LGERTTMKNLDAISNLDFKKIIGQLYDESGCNGDKKKIFLKRFKLIFVIVLFLSFLGYLKFTWYSDFKALYDKKIEAVILDIYLHGRGGRQIKVSPNGEYFSIYSYMDDILKKGDSISKQKESNAFKIYRKSEGKWEHLNTIHIRKDLEFYWLIVKEKD